MIPSAPFSALLRHEHEAPEEQHTPELGGGRDGPRCGDLAVWRSCGSPTRTTSPDGDQEGGMVPSTWLEETRHHVALAERRLTAKLSGPARQDEP